MCAEDLTSVSSSTVSSRTSLRKSEIETSCAHNNTTWTGLSGNGPDRLGLR